ncbi:MAG: hypothetical protein Q9190_007480, partial [Brigantiaea leucoxantha]
MQYVFFAPNTLSQTSSRHFLRRLTSTHLPKNPRSAFHHISPFSNYPTPRPINRQPFRPPSCAIPLSRRHASTNTFRHNLRRLHNAYPFLVPLAFTCIVLSASGLIYVNYVYQSYIIGEFKAYPEPVAMKLRRAVYYTLYDLKPERALEYYSQALQLSRELGMDQFGDPILGVKIQIAKLLQDTRQTRGATELLEQVLEDCLEFVRRVDTGELPGKEDSDGGKSRRADRTRVLGKTVGIGVRLGELYAKDDMQEFENAEEKLVGAVTTVMREKQRREAEGVTDADEGAWMSDDELGGALE